MLFDGVPGVWEREDSGFSVEPAGELDAVLASLGHELRRVRRRYFEVKARRTGPFADLRREILELETLIRSLEVVKRGAGKARS